MTDKVQLIKEEIERRIKNLSYLILNIGNTEDLTKEEYCHCVEQETLKSLLIFINSFQEYPCRQQDTVPYAYLGAYMRHGQPADRS